MISKEIGCFMAVLHFMKDIQTARDSLSVKIKLKNLRLYTYIFVHIKITLHINFPQLMLSDQLMKYEFTCFRRIVI